MDRADGGRETTISSFSWISLYTTDVRTGGGMQGQREREKKVDYKMDERTMRIWPPVRHYCLWHAHLMQMSLWPVNIYLIQTEPCINKRNGFVPIWFDFWLATVDTGRLRRGEIKIGRILVTSLALFPSSRPLSRLSLLLPPSLPPSLSPLCLPLVVGRKLKNSGVAISQVKNSGSHFDRWRISQMVLQNNVNVDAAPRFLHPHLSLSRTTSSTHSTLSTSCWFSQLLFSLFYLSPSVPPLFCLPFYLFLFYFTPLFPAKYAQFWSRLFSAIFQVRPCRGVCKFWAKTSFVSRWWSDIFENGRSSSFFLPIPSSFRSALLTSLALFSHLASSCAFPVFRLDHFPQRRWPSVVSPLSLRWFILRAFTLLSNDRYY